MGCLKCFLSKLKLPSCTTKSITSTPLVNYIYKNLSATIKAVTKNILLKVAAQKVSVANADIKNKPKVLLAVDVTDIYTNIYINCNVNYPYEDFLVDGIPFKLIDGRIFKVLKNELLL